MTLLQEFDGLTATLSNKKKTYNKNKNVGEPRRVILECASASKAAEGVGSGKRV